MVDTVKRINTGCGNCQYQVRGNRNQLPIFSFRQKAGNDTGGIRGDKLPENSVVTAFCPLTNERYAIGCREGVILICDKNGNIRQKLIGHQAAVTAISRKGNKLFSSSYDCTLRLWDLRKGKTESAVIVTSPCSSPIKTDVPSG